MPIAFVLIGLFWLFLGLAGLVLLVTGLRGSRINDHPLCLACRFDLSGTYPEGETCPECGGAIDSEDKITRGQRVRRPQRIVSGAFLLAVALASLVLALPGPGVISLPTAWLQIQADWLPGPPERTAMKELTRRLQGNQLSQGQIDAIVVMVLKQQANLSRPWEPANGDFIEAAYASSLIMPETWSTYVRQGVESDLELEIRPQVRIGDPIPFRWKHDSLRIGSNDSYYLQVSFDLEIGDRRAIIREMYYYVNTSLNNSLHSSSTEFRIDPEQAQLLVEGSQVATIRLNYGISTGVGWPTVPTVASLEISSMVEFVEANVVLVKPVVEPDLDLTMSGNLSANIKAVRSGSDPKAMDWNVSIFHGELPVGVSFDVFARHGGDERLIGSFANRANEQEWRNLTFKNAPDLSVVDLMFRPTPVPARSTVDVFEYWNETIEYLNVPVNDN